MAEGGRERFVGIVCIGLIENQLRNGMAEKGSHTVLVVDDDPGHRGMLEALLGRWGRGMAKRLWRGYANGLLTWC